MSRNVVFTLTSARSGTQFLRRLIDTNVPECMAIHEPYLKPGNSTMFGLPIYDHATKNSKEVASLVKKKSEVIRRYRADTYIETSHAFLKSYWDVAPEFFPDLKVFHLVRHPLEVARSDANRVVFINSWRVPGREYHGRDGKPYHRWGLTGREPIYQGYDVSKLTQFQFSLIQWIEIENRAMQFLTRFDMHRKCMTLASPRDLNAPGLLGRILEFLGLTSPKAESAVEVPDSRNEAPGKPTVVGDDELEQYHEVMRQMPVAYLEIFKREPYSKYDWAELLRR